MTRYVTEDALRAKVQDALASLNPTPLSGEMEEDTPYRLYRLCPCETCNGTGKILPMISPSSPTTRCKVCRGEGKNLALLATATDPQSVGVALVTLAEEGEWDECPFGLMYRPHGETGKWLLKPWGPSARNVSDAGRTLARSKNHDRPS